MTYISWLGGLGILGSSIHNIREQLQSFINKSPELLTMMYCAASTPSSSFAALWSPYACPQYAIVMEGTNMWITTNGGVAWFSPTVSSFVTGDIKEWLDTTVQSGWLFCDGGAELISSYSALSTFLSARNIRRPLLMSAWTSSSQATFTISNGIRNLANGDTVNLYWNSGANSRLGMTVSGASSSSFTVSGGSGDSIPNSVGMAAEFKFSATKFLLPDRRGLSPLGNDSMGGVAANRVTAAAADTLLSTGGAETHTLSSGELAVHSHNIPLFNAGHSAGAAGVLGNSTSNVTGGTASAGGGSAHANMSPYTTVNYIIKV